MNRYELNNEQWDKIKTYIPGSTGKRGRPSKNNRQMLNGMVWLARSGAAWRDLPERYGSWKTVYSKFTKWRDEGIFEKIFKELSGDIDAENFMIDSTFIKVHQSANGGVKKGNKKQ
jgi:transposase